MTIQMFLQLVASLTDIPTTINPLTLDDSIHVFQDSGINMIRIKLNDAFGKKLLLDYDSSDVYKNDSTFHNAFKGLQVYAEGANNALLRIGLTDANTKLALYYRYHPEDSASTVVKSAVKYFIVNQNLIPVPILILYCETEKMRQ